MTGSISVLLPVRDGQGTIAAAITDLLTGMERQDELVVVDDGSEDDTPRILNELALGQPRLRVLRTRGVGLVGALNLGLSECDNEWVARADADDRYPQDRLRSQRALVGPGTVLVTGDYRLCAGSGALGELPCALTSPFVVASLIHPQRIPHPGVLLNRSAVAAAGGYREEDFPAEDLALWLRLARLGTFVGTPTRVVEWTMAGSSITHTRQVSQRAKTAELLRANFPAELVEHLTPEDVAAELASYSGTRLAAMRAVLLHRDLQALQGQGVGRASLRVARDALMRSPGRSAAAVATLARDKLRRDGIRGRFGAEPDWRAGSSRR